MRDGRERGMKGGGTEEGSGETQYSCLYAPCEHMYSSTQSSKMRVRSLTTPVQLLTCSFGFKICSSKQKHWILLKYCPASNGTTLYVEIPVTGFSVGLRAV